MVQEWKEEFYNQIQVGNRTFFLFKHYTKIGDGNWDLAYISAEKSRHPNDAGTDFVCESGAGISEKAMENQIKRFLNKKYGDY